MITPSRSVVIRAAIVDDLPRLTEIYNHYIVHTPITFDLDPFSVDERRPWFAQFAPAGPHRLLVAEDGGAVLGYAGTHQFRAKKAYDTTIYCAPEATGRGVGPLLYTALFDALRGEDIHMIVAGITLPNEASVALHERFGSRPSASCTPSAASSASTGTSPGTNAAWVSAALLY